MSNAARHLNPLLKFALELGPLGVLLLANARPALFIPLLGPLLPANLSPDQLGIFTATAAFMIATLIALAIHYALVRQLPIMPLVSGVAVLIFGTLTLVLKDELFIKLKPTIVNCLFGGALLGGLAFGRPLLPVLFNAVLRLTDEGWRKLTLRWGIFFFVLAALNEIVWRTQSNDVWLNFKSLGVMPLTIVFALAQMPLLMRYAAPEDAPAEPVKNPDSLIE